MAVIQKSRPGDRVAVIVDFYDQEGRRVRETVGFYKVGRERQRQAVLDLATTREAERRTQVRAGTYVNPRVERREAKRALAAAKAAEAAAITFRDFLVIFVRDYCTHRRSTFHQDVLRVTAREFGARTLKSITKSELDAYLARLATARKASTVRRYRAVLRVFFRMAVEWGALESSPAEKLIAPPEPPHKVRFLSPGEWHTLREAAEPWLRPILEFALLTGLRLKEVTGLRWADYDVPAGTVTLSGENKTASVRTIPLSAQARAVLEAQVRHVHHPKVFARWDGMPFSGKYDNQTLSKITVRTARAAGLQKVGFHTLRHTFGTWAAQSDVNAAKIQFLMGHASLTTTQIYMNIGAEDARGAVDAVGAKLAMAQEERGAGHPMDTSVHTRAKGALA